MNETDDRDDKLELALETLRISLKEEGCDSDFRKWIDLLDRCESPLEKLLLIDFKTAFGACPLEATEPPTLAGLIIVPELADYPLRISIQHPIRVARRDYRADFVFTIFDRENAMKKIFSLVVEVDGHDFHEKTKEQARRDKQRDRDMTVEGYRILRYTGSEVWHDESRVSSEIESFLIAEMERRRPRGAT